jgi:hypothetical protein
LGQAVNCLGSHLPITDVAQVELAVENAEADLVRRINKYYTYAAPALRPAGTKRRSGVHQTIPVGVTPAGIAITPMAEKSASKENGFLLVPASDAGKHYGELAQNTLADIHLVNVPGQADLMFCREQAELSLEDLERILRSSRAAYEQGVTVPQSSPHARFDIQDWMPLDP